MSDVRYPDSADPAPRLSRTLVAALERPVPEALPPSAANVALLGLLTAGLLPAWSMAARFRDALRWRHHLVEHVGEWIKVNLGDDEARPIARTSRPKLEKWLNFAASGSALVAVVSAVWIVVMSPSRAGLLWYADPFRGPMPTLAQIVFVGGLGLAFLLHWLSVNVHLARGRRIARRVAEACGALPTSPKLPAWEWGLRPVPLVVAAILMAFGMIWAAPMLVAAAAHRRTLLVHDRRLLNFLAAQCRDATAKRRPAVSLAPSMGRNTRCPNPICNAVLSPDARFCPQCGSRANGRGEWVE